MVEKLSPGLMCLLGILRIRNLRPQDQKVHNQVLGALKCAANAHPEIDYAGQEGSIVKRILGAIRPILDTAYSKER